jgi:hypothetical protein
VISTCTVCGHLYEAGSEEQAYERPRYCAGTHCDKGGLEKTETVRESLDRRGLSAEPSREGTKKLGFKP